VFIAVADNMSFCRSLLGTTRYTRLVFLIAGMVQLCRQRISFYHLILLENLSYLLSIPDALSYVPAIYPSERFLTLYLSLSGFFQTIVITLMALATIPHSESSWSDLNRFVQLSCTPYFLYINYFIAGKCFAKRSRVLKYETFNDTYQNLPLFKGLGMICILSYSLIFPPDMPSELSATDSAWGFGQLTALLGILVIGGQVGHYCVSPSIIDSSTKRYMRWWALGIPLCVIHLLKGVSVR
jgi:hypothetical protein